MSCLLPERQRHKPRVMVPWWFATMAGSIRLNASTDQGSRPMRNFLVPHSTQMERVAGRPFFMVTASMSREAVLAWHLTQ